MELLRVYIYIYKYPFPFLSLHGVRSAFFKQIVYIEWQCCEKNEFPVQTLESDRVEGYFALATTTGYYSSFHSEPKHLSKDSIAISQNFCF